MDFVEDPWIGIVHINEEGQLIGVDMEWEGL